MKKAFAFLSLALSACWCWFTPSIEPIISILVYFPLLFSNPDGRKTKKINQNTFFGTLFTGIWDEKKFSRTRMKVIRTLAAKLGLGDDYVIQAEKYISIRGNDPIVEIPTIDRYFHRLMFFLSSLLVFIPFCFISFHSFFDPISFHEMNQLILVFIICGLFGLVGMMVARPYFVACAIGKLCEKS